MDGPVGQELNGAMQKKGFRLLGFYEAGIRHIMTKKPIESFEDLQGLKIRTMQVPAHVASFNAFGANATPLAYGELYGALQTGVVDGAEAANTNYNSKKFYEVAPHWATVAWTALVADLIMSEAKFQQDLFRQRQQPAGDPEGQRRHGDVAGHGAVPQGVRESLCRVRQDAGAKGLAQANPGDSIAPSPERAPGPHGREPSAVERPAVAC
jgi:hypothetical protein